MGDQRPRADMERVVALRLASLERAGLDPQTARTIAERVDIPLPEAVRLGREGYPAEVVLAMLGGSSRPVF